MQEITPTKLKMHRKTGPSEVSLDGFAFVPIDKSRAEDLAGVFVSGYEGTVDYEGETFEDAKVYMQKIFSGEFGEIFENYSWAAIDGNVLAGVCIVLLHKKLNVPYVAFLVTKKEYKRKGVGKTLMLRCLDSLYKDGVGEIVLFVTDTNYPAISLYEGLGFTAV